MVEATLNYAFKDRLVVRPREHPVMVAQSVLATREGREAWSQLLYEKFDSPAMFFATDAVLIWYAARLGTWQRVSCGDGCHTYRTDTVCVCVYSLDVECSYANARTSGLAIDSGYGGTRVVPVQDGYVLRPGTPRASPWTTPVCLRNTVPTICAAQACKSAPLAATLWTSTCTTSCSNRASRCRQPCTPPLAPRRCTRPSSGTTSWCVGVVGVKGLWACDQAWWVRR